MMRTTLAATAAMRTELAMLAAATVALVAAMRGVPDRATEPSASQAAVVAAPEAAASWSRVLAAIDGTLPAAGACPQAARCFEADGAAAFAWVRALEAARWPTPALLRIEATRPEAPLGAAGAVWVELAAPLDAAPARAASSRSEA